MKRTFKLGAFLFPFLVLGITPKRAVYLCQSVLVRAVGFELDALRIEDLMTDLQNAVSSKDPKEYLRMEKLIRDYIISRLKNPDKKAALQREILELLKSDKTTPENRLFVGSFDELIKELIKEDCHHLGNMFAHRTMLLESIQYLEEDAFEYFGHRAYLLMLLEESLIRDPRASDQYKRIFNQKHLKYRQENNLKFEP